MSFVVIDTNVLMVANEDFPPEQADEEDVKACIERLDSIQSGRSKDRVVLDVEDRLLSKRSTEPHYPSPGHFA